MQCYIQGSCYRRLPRRGLPNPGTLGTRGFFACHRNRSVVGWKSKTLATLRSSVLPIKKILDEQNIQIIGEQLFSLIDELGRKKILLNFGNVEYMSSAALGKLITLNKKVAGLERETRAMQHRRQYSRGFRDYSSRQTLRDQRGRARRLTSVLGRRPGTPTSENLSRAFPFPGSIPP